MKIRIAVLSALFILLLVPANCQPLQKEGRSAFLATPEWLNQHLDDKNLVVLEVGDPMDGSRGHSIDKTTGHIPGAQYITEGDVSTPYDPEHKALSLELPSTETLTHIFEELGISNDSHIVLYTSGNYHAATTRVFFTLQYLGLGEHTSILDGGLSKWAAAGYKTAATMPAHARGHIKPIVQPNAAVEAEWINDHLSNEKLTIFDARSLDLYTAERQDRNPRQGHIPGALLLTPEKFFNEDGTYRSRDQIKELFQQSGYKTGNTMVVYCMVGERATVLFFAAHMLGYDVRLYDGSWQDWSRRKELPVVTGEKPGKP